MKFNGWSRGILILLSLGMVSFHVFWMDEEGVRQLRASIEVKNTTLEHTGKRAGQLWIAGEGSLHASSNLTAMAIDDSIPPQESPTENVHSKPGYMEPSTTIESQNLPQAVEIPPFLPNQVFHRYVQQHSESVLWTEWTNHHNNSSRQYAIIYYYCPKRAGNILHSMFNTIVWAILHNRTILWKYDTDFSERNTVADCQAVLERASWFPSFDEWAPRLNLTDKDIDPIRLSVEHVTRNRKPRLVAFPMIVDQMSHHKLFQRVEWRHDPLYKEQHREYVIAMGPEVVTMAQQLYDLGADFLLGMLFRSIFTVKLPMENLTSVAKDAFSVALHSRHTVVGDDGSIISDETRCLEEMLPKVTVSNNCAVYLMSDRPKTVQALTEWLQQRNCTGISLPSSPASTSLYETEHGPNPGDGFIRDLNLVSLARSGIVGDPGRSSFMLLKELIEYDRRIDDWHQNRTGKTKSLPLCTLPGRFGKGYNYGPDSPHFIAHWHRDSLKPVDAFQQYKKQHSMDAIAREGVNARRRYVVGYIPCPIAESLQGLHGFLNYLVRAIVSNRTILWKHPDQDDCAQRSELECSSKNCDKFLHVQQWLPRYDQHNIASPNGTVETFPFQFEPFNPSDLLMNASDLNKKMIKSLFDEGVDFLYGMLWDESFSFGLAVRNNTRPSLDPDAHTSTIYAPIHWDESRREDATQCLRIGASNVSDCTIFLAEGELDRNLLPHCSIITNDHDSSPNGKAIGFLRTMLFASQNTHSVFVAPLNSTKATILREAIQYRKLKQEWKLGRIPSLHGNLKVCQS